MQLVRHWINGSTVQYLSFEAGSNAGVSVTPREPAPEIRFRRLDGSGPMTVSFRSHFNWTGTTPETPFVEQHGLGRDQLFLRPPANATAGRPGGRPMAESTAVVTATSWPAGMTATNPLFTMGENQTRVTGADTVRTAAPNTTVPNPPPSSQNTPQAAPPDAAAGGDGNSTTTMPDPQALGNNSGNETTARPPPAVNETTNSAAANVARVLAAIAGPGAGVADQMSFLTYDTEFLAGGWRFLTCECRVSPRL